MGRLGILVIVLLATSIMGWKMLKPEQAPQIAETNAEGADYWIDGVNLTVYNELGQASYRLEADRLSHQLEGGEHRIGTPHMTIHNAQSERWHIQADEGVVNATGDEVVFHGNVVMQRRMAEADANAPVPLEVLSDDMTVLPDQGRLETAGPVEIRSPTSETHAVGMRAFTETERLLLLSNVRSRQLPTVK